MLRTILSHLLIFSLFGLIPAESSAQTIDKNQDEVSWEYISKLLKQNLFIIDAPGSGYSYSRDGKGVRFSEENLKIFISIYTVPSPYNKVIEEARKNLNMGGYTFLDSAHLISKSGNKGFRTVQEVAAHDPGIYDVQVVMVTIFDYNGYSVLVSSVCPKKLDKEWRQKLIASSLTLREEKSK
jgi:hypothetical protein